MSRFHSMRQHPAGLDLPARRAARLMEAALDQEAIDAANRRLVYADDVMELSELPIWVKAAYTAVGVIGLFLLVMTAAVLGEITGGWPA